MKICNSCIRRDHNEEPHSDCMCGCHSLKEDFGLAFLANDEAFSPRWHFEQLCRGTRHELVKELAQKVRTFDLSAYDENKRGEEMRAYVLDLFETFRTDFTEPPKE